MSESTYEPAAYQPPVLRIAATYAPAEGQALPAGHPDNVEIELNLPELGNSDDLTLSGFVTAIVASLFRYGAEPPTVAVDQPQPAAAQQPLPFAPTPGQGFSYPPGVRTTGLQPWSATTTETTNGATGAEAA